MEEVKRLMDASGYDYAFAYATVEEIAAGAACGQLSIIAE